MQIFIMNQKYSQIPWFLFMAIFLFSCQSEPPFSAGTEEFVLPEGLSIQLIAAEPLLNSPVALAFDERSRIWAVELPGYMRDIDGSEEEKRDGKIVLLTDKNGDGIMDKRRVILDGLQAPRTLLHVYGGLLYNDGPALWWTPLNGLKPGKKVLVDSMYIRGGNIEHQPNGLLYNLDNWIYSACSNVRYRRKNGKWLREATAFRGQWGLSADKKGRLYYNNNSLPIATDYALPNQLTQNPYQKVRYGLNQAIATSKELYPYQATSVNRGYSEGVLDSTGKVKAFTSACSPLYFTGDKLGGSYSLPDAIFVCAPEANLIKCYLDFPDFTLQDKHRALPHPEFEETEFLISKDETFRPINLYNAPDGSLYVLDLRKGIIQHRAYMTSYLREKILEKGLDSIHSRGRIYRISKEEFQDIRLKDYARLSEAEWVDLLESGNHYEKILAQKHLVAKPSEKLISRLQNLALTPNFPALRTLEGMGFLEKENIPEIDELSAAEYFDGDFLAACQELNVDSLMVKYGDPSIHFPGSRWNHIQVILRLGQSSFKGSQELLIKTIDRGATKDPILCEALISGIRGEEEEWLKISRERWPKDSLTKLLEEVLENKKDQDIQAPQLPSQKTHDVRTAGMAIYQQHCSACHGMDGRGKEQLAPPLLNSEYVGGSKDQLILLLLNGMKGPLTVNGKRYEMNAVMPGLKDNPEISDQDIADLIIFLRNSFSFSSTYVPKQQVTKWRSFSEDRMEPFTEDELKKF